MSDIHEFNYDKLRTWIRDARNNDLSWEAVKLANQLSLEMLQIELERRIVQDFWPRGLNVESWTALVQEEEKLENNRLTISLEDDKAMVATKDVENNIQVPLDANSAWVAYRRHLKNGGWAQDSIDEVESATYQVLKKLNKDIPDRQPTKGMVVGHVQSGKTANMAAVMAMAADWGWNMFIVLSGTIDNLRRQTEQRLLHDLNHPGNLFWNPIDHPSLKSHYGQRTPQLSFEKGSQRRYFTVCLKNAKRLEDLIKWMQEDKNKLQQMKIIIIDDEADQGGINTANFDSKERTKINKLIVNLVEGNKTNSVKFDAAPNVMNYIGYTATPYANFLNESSRESLYPRHFIRTLQPSKEYFGPKQIFGINGTEDCDGLDILREVKKDDLSAIKSLHAGESLGMPQCMTDSLAWFLCSVAAMRVQGYKKSISFLVHTSQKQNHHDNVADAIQQWLALPKKSIITICRKVWDIETKQFGLEKFKKQFSSYPTMDKIRNYPDFSELENEIAKLISKVDNILMDNDDVLTYHEGIHLCIDNCSKNNSDENAFIRLAYPDSTKPDYPSPAPAFIVVGGNTLSRGLTIEGLVSTFFLRTSTQADTLMQMGRWFGFRKGYELYPRIWMTNETQTKFKELAELEYELREDLKSFMHAGKDPSEFGPKVRAFPKGIKLKITAANRMKQAMAADLDYSGTNAQTVVFKNNFNELNHNIKIVELFLQSLGTGQISHSKRSLVWKDVSFDLIKNGLLYNRFKFHERASVFNQIEAFCNWYEAASEKTGFSNWNIIVSGTKSEQNDKLWELPGGRINKIGRSQKVQSTESDSINIGVLRAPNDLFEDFDKQVIQDEEIQRVLKAGAPRNSVIMETREKAGVALSPLLIIYRIDKDSEANVRTVPGEQPARKDLNAEADIIGMSMWIPGTKSNSIVKNLTVKIDPSDADDDYETGDGHED
ncbi:Z1 domain-containing protein [Paenibacillus catalpae]|uniref:Z1 domain-containing protein n=1 Tax=Paenibacillus catalpae TaxID=1045775 RepID=A0A1I2E3X1_9BACL|nr:Z1 domain-containing protein [Paenibacillus catalpae]SFE86900.1 Z1 domain-containing protein [Paenibacillus catalpae]